VEDVDLCARLGAIGRIRYVADAAIVHLGRISSRANRAFVYTSYECGWARYLRKHLGGAGLYKPLVTLDGPLRLLLWSCAAAINAISGRRERARYYRERAAAVAGFLLGGLGAFWRS
jgi:GT2 family glycosyltransferase